MGAVYEAEQVDLRRKVAVKVITGDAEPDQILRFKQEALAAASLAHPNIVQVFDFIDGAEPILVMELLRGRSLAALVKKTGRLVPERAVSMLEQVLSALAAAHDARIVHRDVKPENIFVCESPLPYELIKVLDFGLARPLDESRHIARTRAGVALGTPAYMAPEQARGQGADVRMDVFAAGVTLYYALAGRRPFEGKTTSELVNAVRKQPPIPLDALCPDLDLDLVRVVERSLSKDPDARFATARAFATALRRPIAELPPPPIVPDAAIARERSTAGGRKRPRLAIAKPEPISPAIAPGMVVLGRFAHDGESALAIGPSGLARWTLDAGWSARDLPPDVRPSTIRGIAFGPHGEALFIAASDQTFVRVRGAWAPVLVPHGFVIEGGHVDGTSHVVLAGEFAGEDGAIIESAPSGRSKHDIAHRVKMYAATRAANQAVVACGSRGTLCVIEGDRVHAHAAGRASLRAIAPLGAGFIAVGEDMYVHAEDATSDALARATESKFIDDDLSMLRTLGKLVCAAGRRVHVAAIDAPSRVASATVTANIHDVWMGLSANDVPVVRILTSDAAVLEAEITGVP